MDQIYTAFAQAVMSANGAYVAAEFKQPSGSNTQQFTQGKLETYHSAQPSYSQEWISNAAYATNIAMHNYRLGNSDSEFDSVTGGNYNDVLYGVAHENLSLEGGAGDDILVATGSKDRYFCSINGDAGNDFIALGTSFINTTTGNFLAHWQSLLSGINTSQLPSVLTRESSLNTPENGITTYYSAYGGAGSDTILGSQSSDYIAGDDGNDYLFGEGGDDWIMGGAGNDQLYGGAGIERLYGGLGHDYVDGGDGNDYLYGGDIDNAYPEKNAGDDTLNGGAGDDTLDGGNDNDVLSGGMGNDSIMGGNGTDLVSYLYSNVGVTVNLQAGTAQGSAGDIDTLKSIENVQGSNFNDDILGDSNSNILVGGAGSDLYYMGTLIDSGSVFSTGNDIIIEASADAGTDFLSIIGNYTADDVLFGRSGNDLLFGLTSGETVLLYDYYLNGGLEYLELGGSLFSVAALAENAPSLNAVGYSMNEADSAQLASIALSGVSSAEFVDAGIFSV